MNEVKIANLTIGEKHKPFVIAEMSGNHNQSLSRALEIVDAAAATGVQAIKLQTYTADTITMENVFTINDSNSLWKGKDLHTLYKEAYTPWEWHAPIFERAKQKGLICFSSPFDESSVDFLETLNVPCYKIASFENTHHPLLKKVAATGKPVIMSTGVASFDDIKESIEVLKNNGCKDLVILKCTSTYPASPENTNILTIPDMIEKFNCLVGLSDHTMGIGVSIGAVALGATVLEKHFTLSRADGGVDSAFSMEPAEMKMLVEESEKAWLARGKISYELTEKEKVSLVFKRSIYISEDVEEGTIITEKNIRVIRPAMGMAPKYYFEILGKKFNKKLKKGTPLKMEDVG